MGPFSNFPQWGKFLQAIPKQWKYVCKNINIYMLILISKDFDMVMIISVGESCLWVPWVIFKLLTDVQWGQSLGFCYHCLHLFPYHPTIKGEKEREETSNVYFRVIMLDAALSRVGKKKRKKDL